MNFLTTARRLLFEGSTVWIDRMIAAEERRADAADARSLRRRRDMEAQVPRATFGAVDRSRPLND